MKIQSKLFIAFLLTSSLLVCSLFVATQWALNTGLLKYVNQREQGILEEQASILAEQFEIAGNWQFISQRGSSRRNAPPDSSETLWNRPPPEGFHPPHRDDTRRPPHLKRPPHERGMESRHPPRFREDSPLSRPPQDRPKHIERNLFKSVPKLPPHVSLYDADKHLLLGRELPLTAGIEWVDIRSNDKVVGWFGVDTPRYLSDDFDLAMAAELNQSVLWLSLAVLLLSALGAYPLSYLLVKRTKSLSEATRDIAAGKLETRVNDPSKDEIGELGQHVNELAFRLAKNEAARNRWIAAISHELRTPVAIAGGEIEAMLDGIREMNPDNLASARQEIMHLTRLIEDLYQLSNLEIGSLSYQKDFVDLKELIETCCLKQAESARAAGLELSYQLQANTNELWLDPDRLQQLIDNLINNSMKYTEAPGQITVSLKQTVDETNICVEDSAPSVTEQELAHLFEPLYRVENSRNRKTGGAGLGLGICERIAHAHGGHIKAYLSPLGGLGVRLILPNKTSDIR